MFRRSLPLLLASFADEQISGALKHIDRLVGEGHVYEALKAIRALYPLEKRIVEQGRPSSDEHAATAAQPLRREGDASR